MADHKGQVIPVPVKRTYAYQSETSYPGASIHSAPPMRDRESVEAKKYTAYDLEIRKHTDTAMVITLHKTRADVVDQRRKHGAAVTEDIYQITLDFAELCNRIFGAGCDHFEETEAFPEEVKQLMRKVYDK